MPAIHSINPPRMRAVLCSFALLLATAIEVRAASELPAPSGEFPVGTRTFQWSHSDGNERRELIAQLWYPAAVPGGARADYAPYYEEFDGLKSHSVTDASLAATPRTLPVVIISPGRGVPHHFYTTLAESLASHGYVAMAIDYPQIGRVRYPDGRYIPPDDRFAIPFDILVGPYEQVDAFFEEATRLGSADAEASLRELTALNGNANDPFYQRLDLSRLGAFGHSLGARIIGQTVARDARFVAFASMEGVPPRAARRGGLDAAVLMLSSSELPDMAQANIRELLPARRNIVYLVTLNGFGHNSPTELALLLPAEYSYQIPALEGLQSSVALIKEFFDEQLRKLPDAHMRSFVDGTRIVLETFDE